jgi:hypothetical protein
MENQEDYTFCMHTFKNKKSAQYELFFNGLRTIFFKDQRLEFLADRADGLEFYDIQDVTDAYHCAGNYCDIYFMVCLFYGV